MPNFDVNPTYSTEIEQFETTTKAHAEEFNRRIITLLNNDAFFKQKIGDLSGLNTEEKTDLVKAINEVKESGGIYIGNQAPTNTNLLWIDTGNGSVMKYYNIAAKAWTTVPAVWG